MIHIAQSLTSKQVYYILIYPYSSGTHKILKFPQHTAKRVPNKSIYRDKSERLKNEEEVSKGF